MEQSEIQPNAAERQQSLEIEKRLLNQLPEIALSIIPDSPENDNFRNNPDDVKEHEPRWHQFGIITHTEKTVDHYHQTVPKYLKEWEIEGEVSKALNQDIDGKTKTELLGISMPLHDLGKFSSPRLKKENEFGVMRKHFDHEKRSGEIIRNNLILKKLFADSGLSEKQISYIAECAETHYELSKMRDAAKETDLDFSLEFTESKEGQKACQKIIEKFPDLKIEIGIYYLADSLAKTDIKIKAGSDEDIRNQSDKIKQEINDLNLNPNIAGAVSQGPVNINAAKTYLMQAIR